jgi:hypothetical protein
MKDDLPPEIVAIVQVPLYQEELDRIEWIRTHVKNFPSDKEDVGMTLTTIVKIALSDPAFVTRIADAHIRGMNAEGFYDGGRLFSLLGNAARQRPEYKQ